VSRVKTIAPKPAPTASRPPDLLYPRLLSSGAIGILQELKDYGQPIYDLEAWEFVLDNDFAKYIFDRSRDAKLSPPNTAPVSNTLCDKCAAVRKHIWSPFFKISYTTEELKHNSREPVCDLCFLLWHTYHKFSNVESYRVEFHREGSILKLDGLKSPVLTLCRNNGKHCFRCDSQYTGAKVSVIEPRNRASDVQIGFAVLPAPGQDLYLEILQGWLHHCDEDHSCRRNKDEGASMPTRLIDVGTNDVDMVYLREMEPSDNDDWIALSYRWGPLPHFVTTAKTKGSHMAGMTLKELPQTFQDAIKITRSLGKHYLWIDSICIIHGEGGDIGEESKRMENVYGSAYCVLAASCEINQDLGFLSPRGKARDYITLDSGNSMDGTFYICERIENFQHHVQEGDLGRQEYPFAQRTIFFTEHQTYWECSDGIRCETMVKMRK
jgi:hypothetical protein